MYAIVDFKGFQFKVAEDQTIRVPKCDEAVGATVVMDRVLFVGGDEVRVGSPTVDGTSVEAEVVSHGRGKKVLVGKFLRRRDYHRKNGHRQDFTELKITKISA